MFNQQLVVLDQLVLIAVKNADTVVTSINVPTSMDIALPTVKQVFKETYVTLVSMW